MDINLWEQCLDNLRAEIAAPRFNQWIRPLQAEIKPDHLVLLAPNQFVVSYINDNFLDKIVTALQTLSGNTAPPRVIIKVGARTEGSILPAGTSQKYITPPVKNTTFSHSHLNRTFNFANFVEGKSNQLARAAAMQVAENPGQAYNPLFIYGGVGLGKTHLMHAIGHSILERNPDAKVLYLHSERFVADMVKALQRNAMNEFKRYYRGLNALLIDDIQFFAGKDRSQEEFFHTFNSLFDSQQQIVLTCDRYPKEIDGLEERLKSRFGWGLTTAVEPPELETRVAILMTKAEEVKAATSRRSGFFHCQTYSVQCSRIRRGFKTGASQCAFYRANRDY